MSLKSKEKLRFLAFDETAKFPVSPSNLKNLTAQGVQRAAPYGVLFWNFFRTAEKSAAAMCRFNFREQARENNKLNLSRKHARLTAINSSSQTQSNAEPPFN